MKKVLYSAAHGGFALDRVPLGGGGAVCEHLTAEWRRTRPFNLELVDPSILGVAAPRDKELVQMSEWSYARFCRRFERASTEAILSHEPAQTVVLCNDVSEGPDFQRLAELGYPIYTIYHVDVVDYVTKIYLRGRVKPESATRFYRWIESRPWRRALTDIFELIFQKQQDSVDYSKGLIVPSEEMRSVLKRCYPQIDSGKIHVIPWGIWQDETDAAAVQHEAERLRSEYGIPPQATVLLTLSRISPEKGQDRLLKALALWERQSDFPSEGLWLFVAGEAAYMQGRRFQRTLERLAKRLRRTRVVFTGYASGLRKQALFRLSDLYVFPSRHESYGLTLLEAMRAGLPVLAAHNHGVRDVFQTGTGEMLPPAPERRIAELLADALQRLLADRNRLKAMGRAAQAYAQRQRFEDTAVRVAELLLS